MASNSPVVYMPSATPGPSACIYYGVEPNSRALSAKDHTDKWHRTPPYKVVSRCESSSANANPRFTLIAQVQDSYLHGYHWQHHPQDTGIALAREPTWARQLHIPRPTPTYKRCFGHHTVQGRVMFNISTPGTQVAYWRTQSTDSNRLQPKPMLFIILYLASSTPRSWLPQFKVMSNPVLLPR